MKVHLKIKIRSLAAEARIIRQEEKKWPGESSERYSLHNHRVMDVRAEARASLLAYGFLRGRKYRQLEDKVKEGNEPNWKRVQEIIQKFGAYPRGTNTLQEDVEKWSQE